MQAPGMESRGAATDFTRSVKPIASIGDSPAEKEAVAEDSPFR